MSSVVLALSYWFEFILFYVAVFYHWLSSSVVESSLSHQSIIYCFCCISHLSSGVFCCHFLLVSNCIHFLLCSCRLSSIASCRCIFVLLLKKAFIVFAAVFVFLRVSSVVLAFSLWFEFILFHAAVFYLRLSSVVESSFDPSTIYCFCCISHLSSGVFCCHFLLVSNCIHFLLCSCRLSSIASCRWIFVLLLKKAFIVFAAVFVFLRVSSVVLAFSFWFEFILFHVAVFYLRLSSVVESSLSDPSIIYCFCCISHLSSGVFCCHFLLVSNCIHFLLCSCRLSSIASCRCIFVLLLKKAFIVFAAVFFFLRVSSVVLALSIWFEFILFYVAVFYLRLSSSVVESSLSHPSIIYCFCCISHLSSGVFCCHFLFVSNCIHFLLCSCCLSSIASCRCIFVLLLKKAFIVFAAVFVFVRVSSVVLAFSFWFEFILFHVAVFYLRLSSVVESSLSDPSIIYCFCCISHLSSSVFCCHFLLVSNCIHFLLCSYRLSSIASCRCIFVLLLKKAFIVFAAVFLFLRVSSVVLALSFWFEFILFHVAVFYLRLSSVVESSLSDPSIIYCFCCISHLSLGVFCCHFLLVLYCIQFVPCSCRLSSIASCHCIFVLLLKKAFIVFAAVFLFLRVSSVVLALSFWFEFILFHVAVFYLRLSSVVESSLSDPSIIYCFCCISHLSSGVFCCHFLLVSYCIQFVPCKCRLSSIASCHCIFVLLLKKAFIVFAAMFFFLWVSSVVLALSFWFEFILFHVAVFYLRLSSVVESSLSDPSIIYCFCCISHLSSGVFCCHFLLVSYCIQFVPCKCRLSSIASCHCIFVLLLKKAFIVFAAMFFFLWVSSVVLALSFWFEFILFHVAVFYLRLSSVVESSLSDPSFIYCFCCISHLSSGVFCCHFLLVSYCIQFVPCSCRLSSIASCHCIFVLLLKKHLLYLLRCSSFFGCLLLSSSCHSDLNSFCSM